MKIKGIFRTYNALESHVVNEITLECDTTNGDSKGDFYTEVERITKAFGSKVTFHAHAQEPVLPHVSEQQLVVDPLLSQVLQSPNLF